MRLRPVESRSRTSWPQTAPGYGLRKLVLVLVGVFLLLYLVPAPAQIREVRRVLIFNELGPWSPGITAINKEIFAALETSPYQIEFYSESLDTSLFPDEASQREFRDWYFHKYRDRKPDLIIAIGPSPLKFMSESHEAFSPGTPIVFWGSTEESAEPPRLDSSFTGVWGVAHPDKTLDLALRLQPNTKHVVVVGGMAPYDRQLESLVKQRFQRYESRLDFTYLTDLAMPDLLERLKHLPSNTIVYYTSLMEDATGKPFIGAGQSVPMIASAAAAPVFVVDDVDIGRGTVGGDVVGFALGGQVAGGIALRLLNGEKPQNIPMVRGANINMFDWRALTRWDLKESDLPPGSIVLNRQPTIWEAYKGYIISGISLILVQTLLIFALVLQRTRRKEAETQLAITYDRLRMAVEAGRSVGWDWDLKSGRDRWFGDLETMFGIPSDSYSGHVDDFRRKIYPEDRELAWRAVNDARQNRKPYTAEFRVVRTDGTVRWITARGKFYYAQNGDPERMLGMAVDITDRKHAEHQLRESQDQLAGIVGSAMDAIIAVDDEQRIVLFNTAAEKMFGCTTGDAVGAAIDRFIPQRFSPERAAHMSHFGASGVTARTMGMLGALWAVRTNGEEFPIEASISHVTSDGRQLFTVIIRDTTERQKAEERVRESEARFRLVANTAPVMIWMAGPDKLCEYFNQPWLNFTGRPLEAELGNGWAEGVHAEDLNACLDTYARAFDQHQPFKMQYRLRRNDGEYRWVLDIGVPRFNPDGFLAGYIGSCLDVTERKMAEDALTRLGGQLIEAQEGERKRIAREIHDDYNQRLAMMAIDLETMIGDIGESSVEAGERLHDLVNRVGELGADLHSLSHRLHSSTLETLGLVAGVKGFCEEFAEQQGIHVAFAQENVPHGIPQDAAICLFRIAQEGLRNIKRHSGANRAEVRLEWSGEQLHLSISDRGRGFSPNQPPADGGIGIRSMQERLRVLGGHLEIHSRPMEGTRIDAWLPFQIATQRAS